ncbi:hypothetical protein [Marinactinospora rubrisoli]|uniref:Uncharacterized protein n=1 Tax=Marinactinospora rubrisoli TaxID=2715399 RepID=A0ABW2KGD0_9ACTN
MFTWRVEFNASAGGPWVVGVVNDPDADEPIGPRDPDRADTEACELTPRILSGAEYMDFPTAVGNYFRGERAVTFPDGFFTVEPQVL